MTKAVHQIHVNIQIGWIDIAIAWGERLLQHGIDDNGCRTATLEQDIASLKRIAEFARKPGSVHAERDTRELKAVREALWQLMRCVELGYKGKPLEDAMAAAEKLLG